MPPYIRPARAWGLTQCALRQQGVDRYKTTLTIIICVLSLGAVPARLHCRAGRGDTRMQSGRGREAIWLFFTSTTLLLTNKSVTIESVSNKSSLSFSDEKLVQHDHDAIYSWRHLSKENRGKEWVTSIVTCIIVILWLYPENCEALCDFLTSLNNSTFSELGIEDKNQLVLRSLRGWVG